MRVCKVVLVVRETSINVTLPGETPIADYMLCKTRPTEIVRTRHGVPPHVAGGSFIDSDRSWSWELSIPTREHREPTTVHLTRPTFCHGSGYGAMQGMGGAA